MTRKSKRALERDIQDLEPADRDRPMFIVETESGDYVGPSGDAIEGEPIIGFTIPYELWNDQWGHPTEKAEEWEP